MLKKNKNYAFGWNSSTWYYPFSKAIYEINIHNPIKKKKILELGCSQYSTVALMFDEFDNQIELSSYDNFSFLELGKKMELLKNKNLFSDNISLSKKNALSFDEKYDLIILKSVLGGVYREGSSSLEDVTDLLKKLRLENLNDGGFIVTCDNGLSFFDKFIQNYGARKNKWMFFKPGDISFEENQFYFGFFSFFSFKIRLGFIGMLIEEFILFPVDYFISFITSKYPTVIVTILKK
jgi:hypothetical protein